MGDTKSECIKISNVLRENNINCLLYLEDTKFKNKMAYASKSGIKFAVLVGEDEANGGYVTLKNLTEFSQQQLPLAQAVEILKN